MIEAIYIAPADGASQQRVEQARLVARGGIVGDRNFGKTKWPGQNITFVEQEEIDSFNRLHGQCVAQDATRRNVVTRGVRLNDLVGEEFRIGAVRFLGVRLCEPCMLLGGNLENDTLAAKDVVAAFRGRAGLRADVLCDGVIAVGMEIVA